MREAKGHNGTLADTRPSGKRMTLDPISFSQLVQRYVNLSSLIYAIMFAFAGS
jgi:hypothetical protein